MHDRKVHNRKGSAGGGSWCETRVIEAAAQRGYCGRVVGRRYQDNPPGVAAEGPTTHNDGEIHAGQLLTSSERIGLESYASGTTILSYLLRLGGSVAPSRPPRPGPSQRGSPTCASRCESVFTRLPCSARLLGPDVSTRARVVGGVGSV